MKWTAYVSTEYIFSDMPLKRKVNSECADITFGVVDVSLPQVFSAYLVFWTFLAALPIIQGETTSLPSPGGLITLPANGSDDYQNKAVDNPCALNFSVTLQKKWLFPLLWDLLGNLWVRRVLGKYFFLPIAVLVTRFANEKTISQRSAITSMEVLLENRKCNTIKSYRGAQWSVLILYPQSTWSSFQAPGSQHEVGMWLSPDPSSCPHRLVWPPMSVWREKP